VPAVEGTEHPSTARQPAFKGRFETRETVMSEPTKSKSGKLPSRAAKVPVHRFEVSLISVRVSGVARHKVEGHVQSRSRGLVEFLTVAIGDLVVYCYDAASVQSFVTAWGQALRYASKVPLPEKIEHPEPAWHRAGVIVRAEGVTDHQVHGFPARLSPSGSAAVRVRVGALQVYAHDLDAVRCWDSAWQGALLAGRRLWPQPDAFDEAEQQSRRRMERYGVLPVGYPPDDVEAQRGSGQA
jgi:hypothetical protein